MKWYYNSKSGLVGHYNELLFYGALHSGTGWHGPFDTKETAIKYYTDGKAKNTGWKAPTDSIADAAGQAADFAADTAVNTVLDKVGLSDADIQSWLIRIGEILLGIVLIGVGVASLSGATNLVSKAVKAKI